jgi:hypothetical protein
VDLQLVTKGGYRFTMPEIFVVQVSRPITTAAVSDVRFEDTQVTSELEAHRRHN